MILVAGRMRSGKTYLVTKIAGAYSRMGKSVIAYNVGMEIDFPGFEWVEFFTIDRTARFFETKHEKRAFLNNPTIELFSFMGKVYHIKDFNAVVKNTPVKCYRIPDLKSEELFFESVFLYIKNAFLILDDTRSIFRYGIKAQAINLFSRINHTGRDSSAKTLSNGIDIALIFHNLESINTEFYDYATNLIMFHCARKPDLKSITNNENISDLVSLCFDEITPMPERSFIELDLKQLTYIKHGPEKTQNI